MSSTAFDCICGYSLSRFRQKIGKELNYFCSANGMFCLFPFHVFVLLTCPVSFVVIVVV